MDHKKANKNGSEYNLKANKGLIFEHFFLSLKLTKRGNEQTFTSSICQLNYVFRCMKCPSLKCRKKLTEKKSFQIFR
jgi:hypothetical protein